MISPAPFADLLILHSFLFLVNLFFDFFSPFNFIGFDLLNTNSLKHAVSWQRSSVFQQPRTSTQRQRWYFSKKKDSLQGFFYIYFCFLHNPLDTTKTKYHTYKKRTPKRHPKQKKEPAACYFRTAVLSSPLWCLTSVFGMGTGVSIMLSLPDLFSLSNSFRESLKTG